MDGMGRGAKDYSGKGRPKNCLKLQCGSKGDVTVVMTVNDMGLNDRDETRRMAIANKTCVSGKKLISIIDYDVCMTFY